ncbi:hypothetical protein SCA6_017224 [Theobroma cacao]
MESILNSWTTRWAFGLVIANCLRQFLNLVNMGKSRFNSKSQVHRLNKATTISTKFNVINSPDAVLERGARDILTHSSINFSSHVPIHSQFSAKARNFPVSGKRPKSPLFDATIKTKFQKKKNLFFIITIIV